MKSFGQDKIIVLLGAGASYDANIPHSAKMIEEIEKKLKKDWSELKPIYKYIKSAIYHIKSLKDEEVVFNIETLVEVLDDLITIKEKDHSLYPFIGSWEKDLISVVGKDFNLVKEFKDKILSILRNEWIPCEDFESEYYKRLNDFALSLDFSLRIFTLNYDLCVETHCEKVELGFSKNEDRIWNHKNFELTEHEPPNIYLYKLHGSINWFRKNNYFILYFTIII